LLCQRRIGWKSQILPIYTPLSLSALVRGDPFQIYRKALRFLKIVFQAGDGEDLLILPCTVFDSRVTDGQTDGQTELRWLRRATAVAAVARKTVHLGNLSET